jgi:hypothetical protein
MPMSDALALVKRELEPAQILAPSNEFQVVIATVASEVDEEAKRRVKTLYPNLNGIGQRAAIAAARLVVLGDMEFVLREEVTDTLEALEKGELWSSHPSSPGSLNELTHDHGISLSEASDLLCWRKTIFPYLSEKLGIHAYEIWKRLGKSKMRRLTPILRQLLDPDNARHSEKVATAIEAFHDEIEDDIVAAMASQAVDRWASETGNEDDEAIAKQIVNFGAPDPATAEALQMQFIEAHPEFDETREVVARILDVADTKTHADMEASLRPGSTPPLHFDVTHHTMYVIEGGTGEKLHSGERYTLVATLDQDQFDLLQRRFSDGRGDIRVQRGDDLVDKPI